jgi:hypothetical protein
LAGIITTRRITSPAELIYTLKNLNCEFLLVREEIGLEFRLNLIIKGISLILVSHRTGIIYNNI